MYDSSYERQVPPRRLMTTYMLASLLYRRDVRNLGNLGQSQFFSTFVSSANIEQLLYSRYRQGALNITVKGVDMTSVLWKPTIQLRR